MDRLSWLLALACAAPVPAAAVQQKKKAPLAWQKLGAGCTQRFAHTAVWNPRDATFLLFAGESSGAGGGFDFHDDLWEWRAKESSWKKLEPAGKKPPMRAYHAAAFDTTQNAMWVYGGCAGDFQAKGDLWRFDVDKNAWSAIETKGEKPAPRFNPALHHDAKRNRLVLYGGTKGFAMDAAVGDAWVFDIAKSEWARQKAKGPALWQFASAYDAEQGTLYVHGGFDGSMSPRNDAHAYDVAADRWSELANGPRTDAHAGVFDPVGKRFVIHGGAVSGKKEGLAELWAFSPKTGKWTKLDVAGEGPGPRAYHSVVLDPAGKSLLLFGGTVNQFNDPVAPADTWRLELTGYP